MWGNSGNLYTMKSIINRCVLWSLALSLGLNLTSCGENSNSFDSYINDIRNAKLVSVKVLSADNKVGYVNSDGELIIPARYENAGYFHDGLALVIDSVGMSGYINSRGEYEILPQYKSATDFLEGLAWVAEPDSALKVINKKGEVIFSLKKAQKASIFTDGYAKFYTATGEIGLVDNKGSEIQLPDLIEDIPAICKNKIFINYKNGSHGIGRINVANLEFISVPGNPDIVNVNLEKELLVNNVDGRLGLMDFNGKVIINPQYSKLDFDGTDLLIFESDKDKYGWLDLTGKIVIQAKYKAVKSFFGNQDYAVVSTSGRKYMAINKKGKTVINAKYKELFHTIFSPNLFAMGNDNLFGIMKADGSVLCEPQFENIVFASEYITLATSGDDKWGVINNSGNYQGVADFLPGNYFESLSAESQKVDVENIVALSMKLRDKANFEIAWPVLAESFEINKYLIYPNSNIVKLKRISLPGIDISFQVYLDGLPLTNTRTIANASFNDKAHPYAYLLKISANSSDTREQILVAMEKATGLECAVSDLTPAMENEEDFIPNTIDLFITPDEEFLNTFIK